MNKRRKNIMKILLIIVYIILTLAGLILMKKGGNTGSVSVENGNLLFGMNIISLLGFLCYICSFILFTRIVLIFDLSYIMPLCTGIIQVAILITSYFIFKEEISKQGIIGATLVIIGIIIMNINNIKK